MDILVGKSKLIKVGSMVLVAVFIIICYQLDVGAAKGNSKMLSTYFTYSGKFRVEVEVLDIKETSSIEDCNGIYFCQVVKQAPVYGGIDLAIAIIIILIELLEKPVLKDKIQPDLLKTLFLYHSQLDLVSLWQQCFNFGLQREAIIISVQVVKSQLSSIIYCLDSAVLSNSRLNHPKDKTLY